MYIASATIPEFQPRRYRAANYYAVLRMGFGLTYHPPAFRPDAGFWARSELDRQKKQEVLKRPIEPAAAGGKAAVKSATGSTAKGLASSFKKVVASLTRMLAPSAPGAPLSRSHDEDEEDSIAMARYWSKSGSSEDFRKSPNGKLVYEGLSL